MALTRLLHRFRKPTQVDLCEQTQAAKHRFRISTEDFLTGGGEPMKRYSVTMYAPTAHEASLRALNLIETRFAPNTMPKVTSIECDMGCFDRYHN